MRISGHTNLDAFDQLPEEVRTSLRSLWIDSIEELLALAAAADPELLRKAIPSADEAVERTRRSAVSLLGAPKADTLSQARPGGALGCALDPDVVRRFAAAGDLRPLRSQPAYVSTASLPSSVQLMHRLHPTRNQGERGTCVAFSSIALREFLLPGSEQLSEQFLYWACKELDGLPGAGTYIRTAMTALNLYGSCRRDSWPYEPRPIRGNEGQGPPPTEAIIEAMDYKMIHSRPVEPTLVDQYKQILAGSWGQEGMPVVFAVLVFNSWFMSSETHRTGKLTMPLPGERHTDAGHAMCVVGYVDDADAPGGGYFIVRNSWGNEWAAQSPVAPGHALIPYEYVARYALEAYSGQLSLFGGKPDEPASTAADDPLAPYVRRLTEPVRDGEGRLLPSGSIVLANPATPDRCMEDTPANRRAFEARDCSWTDEERRQVWFPASVEEAPVAFREAAARARTARQQFVAAIGKNLGESLGTPVPYARIPSLLFFVPWEQKIRGITLEKDLTEAFARELEALSGVPEEMAWPDAWRRTLHDVNAVAVFRVGRTARPIHVVVAFVSVLRFQPGAAPTIAPPDESIPDRLVQVYRRWRADRGGPAPAIAYMTMGSVEPWPDGLQAVAAADRWMALSSRGDGSRWTVRTPPPFANRRALVEFCERLKPETRAERIERIATGADELLDSGYEGNVHVKKIARETGDAPHVIEDALLGLVDSARHVVYRLDDGMLAVKRRPSGSKPVLTKGVVRRRGWRRHVWLIGGAAVGASPWLVGKVAPTMVESLIPRQTWQLTVSWIIMILALYLSGCIQAAINRRTRAD